MTGALILIAVVVIGSAATIRVTTWLEETS